ncbi:MAG TPA: carbohydrate ABC transporter permease [Thermoanaerobaculia bacterium]|nr:carbohydrate ABC transporter permease [Thermoanaerobaculia bacterium]
MNRSVSRVLLHAALIAGGAITLFPLVWMISASVMPTGEATSYPPKFFPSSITFEHYRDLFTRLDLGKSFLNSTLVAVAVTAISLLLNSMAGYAFAKLRFAGRERLFGVLIAALVIPTQVGMLPLFLLLKSLGLVNTYWGVIIPGLASIFGIFLIRQSLLAIPDEILDAARIDGAGEFRIYWSIVLPLARPALVTLALFTFMASWNDFMWPLIVLSDDDKYTLPVSVANLVGEHVQDVELMMASSVLTVVPVLVLFLMLQKHYIAGLMVGGVKG